MKLLNLNRQEAINTAAYVGVAILSVGAAVLIATGFLGRTRAQSPADAAALANPAKTIDDAKTAVHTAEGQMENRAQNAAAAGPSSAPGTSEPPASTAPAQPAANASAPTTPAPTQDTTQATAAQGAPPPSTPAQPAAPTSAPGSAPPAAAQATAGSPSKEGENTPGAASELEGFLEPFIYDVLNRRDPFLPYAEYSPGEGQPNSRPLTPAQRFDLDQLKLVGIMWDIKDPKAMFTDPDSEVIVLGRDDGIGNRSGYIASIREGEVVVVEALRKRGEIIYKTRVLRIER